MILVRPAAAVAEAAVTRTAQGRLRGVRDGAALRFLGIPYAQPPLAAGRFTAPVPHPAWDGVRDALEFGATSPQPDRGITLIPEPVIPGDNELNLNVFTPDLGAAGLPVLVWIHGGGFFGGCNASPWYRGVSFATAGVVLVSINYRLGAEGFLEVPGAAVNRAVRDWVRALEWVQENVAAFGGDPAKVTIAGQSAGGSACATLLGVPAAAGLFRAAICMSRGGARQTADGVRAVAAAMATQLAVPALDAAVLDGFSAGTILAAQQAVMAAESAGQRDAAAVISTLSGAKRPLWAPWRDGEVVTEDPLTAARLPEIRVLSGATAGEFSMAWKDAGWISAETVRDGLAKAGVADGLIRGYLDRGQGPRDVVGQADADRTFRAPAQHLAAAAADAGGAAWAYDFRWTPPGGPHPGFAFHCLDVPFAFGTTAEHGVAEITGGTPPASLTADLHGALVRFVADGDPGWPRYQTSTRPVMLFGEPSTLADDPLWLERRAWPATPGAPQNDRSAL